MTALLHPRLESFYLKAAMLVDRHMAHGLTLCERQEFTCLSCVLAMEAWRVSSPVTRLLHILARREDRRP